MDDFLGSLPGYNLRRASTAVLLELKVALSELDLRLIDASILVTIQEKPRITPSELSKKLGIKRANMVSMVAGLEGRTAVSRYTLNGRSYGLELTDHGKFLCQQAMAIMTECENRIIMRIPEEHRDHLLPALRALWSSPS